MIEMQSYDTPRLLRIARRFNLYLFVGILIVISALGLGAWESTVLQTAHNLEVAGATGTAQYTQATQIEDILRIITPTWNFFGLGFLTFGIGMSIVLIISNLKGTGREAMVAYMQAFPGSRLPMTREPGFARAFPKLMFLGLILLAINFLFALFGSLATAGIIDLTFAGFTAASWGAFVEVLRTPQRPGTLSFIVLGIGLSLATIVYNLRLQARMLPKLMGSLSSGKPMEQRGSLVPGLPRFPFALLVAGFIITLSASYPVGLLGAMARSSLVGGAASPAAAQQLAWATALFPVMAVTGIVVMLAGIVYWLLLIIQALRDQRRLVLTMGSNMAGTQAAPLEQPLWPERVAGYLAGGGVLTLLLLFIPASLLIFIRWEVLRLQGAIGDAFLDLDFMKNFLGTLIPGMRFLGMSLVMLAIGLTLIVIVVNLKGMGSILPGTMARILSSQGKAVGPVISDPDEGDVKSRAEEAMKRFPKKLFIPLLFGALILISTTFPLVVPLHLSLQLQQRDANIAGDMEAASEIKLEIDILAALREPWNFIGMGLVFFAIGRLFGIILGFVQARKVVISDACSSLASGIAPAGGHAPAEEV
ncbi:MAG: hypothetical protein V3U52_07415 [Thermoplasmata archaeon]